MSCEPISQVRMHLVNKYYNPIGSLANEAANVIPNMKIVIRSIESICLMQTASMNNLLLCCQSKDEMFVVMIKSIA